MTILKKHNTLLLLTLFLFTFSIFFSLSLKYRMSSINPNEVPYISTYYITPIVAPNEDVIINFYITDYNHTEYLTEKSYNNFTVTININNKKNIVKKNLKSGDNSINLGKFNTIGEQNFSIKCTDKYGRNSHELFNFFLVKNNSSFNEYELKNSDLNKYNIYNNNDKLHSISTTNGLQKLLDDKKSEGYNKLKLIPGTYIVDASTTLFIPTNFILDLNNSTFKLNGFTGSNSLMISLNNTFDSHVINGTIEGDYYEHDYEGSPNNSEWVNGISIEGESKYSSYENLTVKNITGYGGTNGIANSRDDSLSYSYLPPISIPEFKLGDIDRLSGAFIKSLNRTTCDYIDISNYSNINYLTISRYLGYQGNPCDTWNLICHFYDSNKNYISSIDSYQYRRISIPNDSKYIRVTILSQNYPTDLSIQLFRIPTHCAFKNIKFENCRAVGLAQGAMKDMLVENCEFINCGQVLAKSAYNAEDGWDMMQDVTFKNLNFHDNPNNDFLACAGHNFVVEDMISGKIFIWDRFNSYVFKNNNLTSCIINHGSKFQSKYCRFNNNTFTDIKINGHDWPLIIKDCIIKQIATSTDNTSVFLRCTIGCQNIKTPLLPGIFKDCYIYNKDGENHGGNYYNCNLNNISGNMHGSLFLKDCTINNLSCTVGSYTPTYTLNNCILNNFQLTFPYWHEGALINVNNCSIINDNYLIKLPHYSLKKAINITNNDIKCLDSNGLIIFYDDRTLPNENSLQNVLSINYNTLSLPNSPYVVSGINSTPNNNITISFKGNSLSNKNISVCDYSFLNNSKIKLYLYD